MTDREKLIDILKSPPYGEYSYEEMADNLIAKGVTVQKRGEWEPVDKEANCDEWDCTACGQRRTFLCEMDADDMKEYYRYCPNCGAKMEVNT